MTEETNSKVLSIVANIVKNQKEEAPEDPKTDEEDCETKIKTEPVRGMPKSGRFWKTKKERFSSINKTKGLRSSLEKKNTVMRQISKTKELSRQMREDMKRQELEKKERRRQNLIRGKEKDHRSEIVQVITNASKLKGMKKKQLRFIKKRDTNKMVEVKQQ